jgi:hypothetical protein
MPAPTIDELCTMLTSPDPEVRDGVGYAVLVTRVTRGELDGRLPELGDRIAGHLGHPEIQARPFAPLILDAAVWRDNTIRELDAGTVLRWRDAFATWWSGETDLRGYDARLGWLHAVAHGADLLGTLGGSRHLDQAALAALLDLARRRLTTPTEYLFAHGEDDRLAAALAFVLARGELDAARATGWLKPVHAALEAGEPGPRRGGPMPSVRSTRCMSRSTGVSARARPRACSGRSRR